MSILLDHCVPDLYAKLLVEWGYQVHLLRAHIRPDSDDPDVLALTTSLDAVLLTVDTDFSNILNYPPQNYAGMVILRYRLADEKVLNETLKQALADLYRDDLRGVLVVVKPNRYRIRRSVSEPED